MPSFVLKRLTLLSLKEKRGRRFSFHPKTTVVKGDNDTGKSSLLKSIYRCFGAEPAHSREMEGSSRVIALLSFTVDGKLFQVLRTTPAIASSTGTAITSNRSLGDKRGRPILCKDVSGSASSCQRARTT